MNRLSRVVSVLLVSGLCSSVAAQNGARLGAPPWQQASLWPDRIIQNLSSDPAHEIAINWRTDSNVPSTLAQIAPCRRYSNPNNYVHVAQRLARALQRQQEHGTSPWGHTLYANQVSARRMHPD